MNPFWIVAIILGATVALLIVLLLLLVLFLWICSLLVDPEKEYDRDSAFYRFLADSTIFWIIKLLRIRVHVTGLDKLPKDKKVLVVCNHRSNFDPIVTGYVMKKWNLAFVSKPSNFKIPIYGRIVKKCCYMAIDRVNPRNAILTINRAAKLLEQQVVSIGIYPEGTRSKDGTLLPFHNGVFKIAKKAEKPVAVLCLAGTEQISGRTPFKATDVYLDVLEVFSEETVKQSRTEQLGDTMRELVLNNLEKREKRWQKDT